MSNELTIYNNEQIELIKSTIAKGATNAEFQMFIEFCKGTKLNPFKKEIWFIKTDKGLQMMTGINGFLAIANNHPQYDGMEVEIKEENGKLISATAKVYRKDRKYPSVGTAYFQEYAKNTPTWRQMPRVMLTKVAKSIAIREAFPQELNGLHTKEEMSEEYQFTVESAPTSYIYDIKKLPKESQGVAIAWARSSGLELTEQDGKILVKSNRPLKKLERCQVKEEETSENVLILQNEDAKSEGATEDNSWMDAEVTEEDFK